MVTTPPAGEWVYELKHDGYRAHRVQARRARPASLAQRKRFRRAVPEVAEAVGQLKVKDAIIDGEIVALDAKGHSSFQLLQSLETGEERPPIFFYAFDLLQLEGRDLRDEAA